MKKEGSQKIKTWDKSDFIKTGAVLFANLVFIFVLFLGMLYLKSPSGIDVFFSDAMGVLHFISLLIITIVATALYFYFEHRDFIRDPKNVEMICLILELSIIICFSFGTYVNAYLRPFTLCALLTCFLVNRKSALFMNLISCVLCVLMDLFLLDSMHSADWFEVVASLVFAFTSGIIAIFCISNVYSRFKLLARSFLISIPILACGVFGILSLEVETEQIWKGLVSGACAGPLAVSIFIILLPIFEAIFRKVSCFKLAELTDHKSRLIKKLIAEAPGTFNHSIVVSNIAEACAVAIGEDALFARTCAYYHDIGKLRRPEYFKENQGDGGNRHDDITPELSTSIIKAHTRDGYELVLKNGIPKEIADVCLEHHGTMPILYFYDKAKKFNDGQVDISQYSYSGPKPQSKISAIIMIADGCEAATRTLKDRSVEKVQAVVRKIVNDRMKLGQFDECEITIKELNIVMQTVINSLTGVYHKRIEYPKVNLDGIELQDSKKDE